MAILLGKVIFGKEGCFQWTINNLLEMFCYIDLGVCSPYLPFSGAEYRISAINDKPRNVFSVSLHRKHDSPPQSVYVTIGIRTGKKGKIEKRSGTLMNNNTSINLGSWLQSREFISRRHEILTDGHLMIYCELRRLDEKEKIIVPEEKLPACTVETVPVENKASETSAEEEDKNEYKTCTVETVPVENKASETSAEEEEKNEYKTLKKLQEDLKHLFMSGEDCDVTLKVQSKEFPAHKCILRARSTVFNSMFRHEMVEKENGIVNIDDCDPRIFPDFLSYLYCGSIKLISDKNVCQLYTVSDKYQVQELKEECAKFMKNHLSVETFCEFFTLALKYTEEDLTELTTRFFCGNVVEIAKTSKWQIFLEENSTVGNELFLKALSK